MDDIVQQALARWPNVPAIAGWLRLTARGDWLLTGEVQDGVRITHTNMRRFIDRNYACDETGRWFFQNGPQKVYVSLEYTPWVFSLHPVADGGFCLLSHTRVATVPEAVMLDEDGQFLFRTPLGVGVMRDTDMESITPFLHENAAGAPAAGNAADAASNWMLDVPWQLPTPEQCAAREWRLVPALSLAGVDEPTGNVPQAFVPVVENVVRADMAARFAFNPSPVV